MARETASPRRPRLMRLIVAASWCGLAAFFGCGMQANETLGGETHFLRACDPLAEGCGGGLSCLDQVCTTACSMDVDCVTFGAAQCSSLDVLPTDDTQADESGRCDFACETDDDCAVLSPSHRCEVGACRAPALVDASNEPPAVDPECSVLPESPAGLLVLGDSFFSTEPPLSSELASLARDAGLLGADEAYRDHSSLFDNALAHGGRGIEAAYLAAREEGPAEVIVMDGGGADALLGTCETVDMTCPLLVDAAEALGDLFTRLEADGVLRVVYAFSPDATALDVRARMDALRPLIEGECAESVVPCTFIDLRQAFSGNYEEYLGADGLNPTPEGTRRTAEEIWSALTTCP